MSDTTMMGKLLDRKRDLELELFLKQDEAKPLRAQLADCDRAMARIRKELTTVDESIKQLSVRPNISDHAVVRFLERKYGFSFDQVRDEIMTEGLIQAVQFGASGYKVADGKFVIKGNTIVTYTMKEK